LAQRAEAAGLDSVWVGDSLTAKPRLEPLTTLAAVAARTERVRLGTSVLLMALRHPVLLAQTLATVDLISRGRLLIAAGVGGAFNDEQRQEWDNAGVRSSRRTSRLEEMLRVIKGLGSGGPVTHQGRHFQLEEVEMLPTPVQAGGVPILLACHWRFHRPGEKSVGEAQVQRAASLGDGLISISDTPQEYTELIQRFDQVAADLGRNPDELEKVMYLTVNVGQDLGRAQEEAEGYLTGYYGANIWGTRWGPFGGAERVKERLLEYADAGAETLVVRLATFEPERQLDIFLDQVAPAFQ
jgi:alkanesulfonate monooxygenase SsuD/methylene tetrahydromethanopterin reductase-like flavin-dependent oxidoreductase (luciferase family)